MRTKTFTILNEDENEVEIDLPTKRIVCSRCDGEGTHVNPSIDGHGISAEEWDQDWDDESRDNYFSGVYDVQCEKCGGAKVLDVIDEDEIEEYGSQDQKKALKEYRDSEKEERAYHRMCEYERRFGC